PGTGPPRGAEVTRPPAPGPARPGRRRERGAGRRGSARPGPPRPPPSSPARPRPAREGTPPSGRRCYAGPPRAGLSLDHGESRFDRVVHRAAERPRMTRIPSRRSTAAVPAALLVAGLTVSTAAALPSATSRGGRRSPPAANASRFLALTGGASAPAQEAGSKPGGKPSGSGKHSG